MQIFQHFFSFSCGTWGCYKLYYSIYKVKDNQFLTKVKWKKLFVMSYSHN